MYTCDATRPRSLAAVPGVAIAAFEVGVEVGVAESVDRWRSMINGPWSTAAAGPLLAFDLVYTGRLTLFYGLHEELMD